jgi:predicted RNA-binding protein YlqC (UPF0109 family)
VSPPDGEPTTEQTEGVEPSPSPLLGARGSELGSDADAESMLAPDGVVGLGGVVERGLDEVVDDMAGNRIEGGRARAVCAYVVRSIADDPDSVVVDAEEELGRVRLKVHVAPADMGRVIGRGGRVAQAIRVLARAIGALEGTRVEVDFVGE